MRPHHATSPSMLVGTADDSSEPAAWVRLRSIGSLLLGFGIEACLNACIARTTNSPFEPPCASIQSIRSIGIRTLSDWLLADVPGIGRVWHTTNRFATPGGVFSCLSGATLTALKTGLCCEPLGSEDEVWRACWARAWRCRVSVKNGFTVACLAYDGPLDWLIVGHLGLLTACFAGLSWEEDTGCWGSGLAL